MTIKELVKILQAQKNQDIEIDILAVISRDEKGYYKKVGINTVTTSANGPDKLEITTDIIKM